MKLFKFKAMAACVSFALAAGLFASNANALSRAPEDNLIVGVSTEAIALDPALVDDNYSGDVIGNIYEGLLKFKPNSTDIEPCLAESWTISDDGLTYTFKLRKGVKFHDGTDFNAEAAKFNIERQLPGNVTPKMAYAHLVYGDVAKVEAVDDYTLKITLKKRSTPFLRSMAMSFAAPMVSPSALKAQNNDVSFKPVGTGPYKFVAWDKGQQIILTTFEDYWGAKPKVENVIFKTMKETGARVVALNNGEADIITGIDANVIKQIKDAGNKVFEAPSMSTFYMLFNHRPQELTKDLAVRRAIAQAVNVPDLVKSLYRGYAEYAATYFPEFMAGYSKDTPTVKYDPEAAKKTFQEKGIKQLTILASSNASYSNPVGGQVLAEAVQDYLAKVGVKAKIVVYDWASFKQKVMTDSWDISFIGWNGDSGDSDNFISLFAQNDPLINQGLWQNKDFIALINEGVNVPDGPERTKIYQNAEKIMAEDVGILPISHAKNLMAYRPNIKNASIHPTGLNFVMDVEKEKQ